MLSKPRIDRQGEKQRGRLQRLHQHHRPHGQRDGLQGEAGQSRGAAQPPLTMA